ncbi:MAG: hypothetical protein GTO45_21600 [Candidatus Aminicenantes bacterium]|nr:hypothetical protein [Candidatus Aminicenantes bacterium]NIM81351.1 hypothetical protein [Candidatus Aminicenantes bacterium]NIN20762.1 hypothetical protein [Candidatus Aminicenantes bacterium]NIN44540.1 hypothetical protein [Candidatus Aminicenantes bacterium]NIN87360.1 hypothetical protein [Candidatus Aminicenantes bacterium]
MIKFSCLSPFFLFSKTNPNRTAFEKNAATPGAILPFFEINIPTSGTIASAFETISPTFGASAKGIFAHELTEFSGGSNDFPPGFECNSPGEEQKTVGQALKLAAAALNPDELEENPPGAKGKISSTKENTRAKYIFALAVGFECKKNTCCHQLLICFFSNHPTAPG